MNLLEHEVLKAALFSRDRIPGHCEGFLFHFPSLQVPKRQPLPSNLRYLSVFKGDGLPRPVQESGNIGTKEVFIFSQAEHQRAAHAGANQFSGAILIENGQSVRAAQLR